MRRLALISTLLLLTTVSGCDLFGDSAEKIAAAKEAEGKAIGGACRHAGRAIEDCYALNKKADKASVFAGWRDMNDYMRENKIDAVPPQLIRGAPKSAAMEAKSDDPAKPAADPAMAKPAEGEDAEKRLPKAKAKNAKADH